MSKDAAARKVQEQKPVLTVVQPEKKENNPKIENLRTAAEEVQELKTEPTQEKAVLSIEDIKRKNEVLSRLTAKWDALADKRRRVENFSISHDTDTANVIVRDSNGEVFESNSPKTIGKLLEFWKEEFSTALDQVEKDMREIA
ncbi:MAG: hypothetical protein PHV20_12375 [Bacteroidales bacterium]|nr:hypothetical protein [Bacteroidales bacterium]